MPEQAPRRNSKPEAARGAAHAVDSYRSAGCEVLDLLRDLRHHTSCQPTTHSEPIGTAMRMAGEHGDSHCKAGADSRSGDRPALRDTDAQGQRDAAVGTKDTLLKAVMLVLDGCFDAVAQVMHPPQRAGGRGEDSAVNEPAAALVAWSMQCSVAGWGMEACQVVTALLAQQLLLGGRLDAALKLVEHACYKAAAYVKKLTHEALKLPQVWGPMSPPQHWHQGCMRALLATL
jgi:hypothetical protein